MSVSEREHARKIVDGIPIWEIVRTDLNCTNCSKNFVAQLDFSVDGNHIIECPYCLHEHCRTIKDGLVTGDRWDSRAQRVDVKGLSVWKADSRPIMTSTAAAYLREKWLGRYGNGTDRNH